MTRPVLKTNEYAEPRLGRGDWIDAAMEALISGGVEAVRITRLAETLSVTRGSFYWHFEDRDDLLRALRQRWEDTNTPAIRSAVDRKDCLDRAVLGFFDAWVMPNRFDARLDHAMRAWANLDRDIRKAVEAEDSERINLIAEMFGRFGYPQQEAFIRARILYFAQIGYYALGIHEPATERLGYLESYYLGFTGRDVDPEIASAQRKIYLREME
ncbi:MAG: TetR/AcrR family transcriptional regulator [Pseudomonadota bacterium]